MSAAVCSRPRASSVETGHPVADDVPHGGRHPGALGSVVAEFAVVGEKPGQLPDEERVAAGTGVDAAGGGGTGRLAGLAADQLGHLVRAEREEPDPAVPGLPARHGECARHLGAGNGRAVAQRADDRGALRQPGGQVAEQVQRGAVGPLDVVDDQHDRPPRRHLPDDGDRLLEQAELGAAVRQHQRAVPAARPGEAAELAGLPVLPGRCGQARDDGADHLHPRPHRRGAVALEAAAPYHERAAPARLDAGLLEQAGLSDPWFPLDNDQAGPAGERRRHRLPQNRELLAPADKEIGGRGGMSRFRWRRRPAQQSLVRSQQRRSGIDAQLLGEPGADRPEHRQRLGLLTGGAQRGDESGMHLLVQRRHRGGPKQSRQHQLGPALGNSQLGRRHARLKELTVHRGEDGHRGRAVRQAVTGGSVPQPQRPGETVECRARTLLRGVGQGGLDQFPERDHVQHAGLGQEHVPVAPPLQVHAGPAGRQRRLEQPPQRAGVLLQDVDRRGRDVVAPDQIDQLVRADRPARPDQQQGQQIGLLPGPGVQLDPGPPQPQVAEDLQAHALAVRRQRRSHGAAPARAPSSPALYSTGAGIEIDRSSGGQHRVHRADGAGCLRPAGIRPTLSSRAGGVPLGRRG